MKVRRDIYSIKKEARDILRNKWGNPIKVNVLLTFLTVIMQFLISPIDVATLEIREIPLKNTIIYYVLNFLLLMPLSQGVISFTLKFKRRFESNVGDVFDGYKMFFPLLITTAVNMGMAAIASYLPLWLHVSEVYYNIVFSAALVIVFIAECYLSQCGFILCDGVKNPFKIMVQSVRLMRGNILKYIGLLLSFVMWIIGSMFTMGILMLWFVPYQKVTLAVFYDELTGRREEINEEEPKY